MLNRDFQDYQLWRETVYSLLFNAQTADYLLPMTLIQPHYHTEIVDELRENNVSVQHHMLTAEKEIIQQWLNTRDFCNDEWVLHKLEEYWEQCYRFPVYEQINTSMLLVEEIAEKFVTRYRNEYD